MRKKAAKQFVKLSPKVSSHKGYKYFVNYTEEDFGKVEETEEKQWKRIKKIIEHAYENVTFYREKFDEAGIKPEDIKDREDFRKIPITTKKELRENFPDKLFAQNFREKEVRFTNTSGTTGRPTLLLQDKEDVNRKYAAKLRSREVYGTEIGDKVVRVTPNECQPAKKEGGGIKTVPDHFKELFRNPVNGFFAIAENFVKKFVHNKKVLEPIGVDSTKTFEKDVLERIEEIREEEPDILSIYPLYAYHLAKKIEEEELDPPKVGCIDFTGGLVTSEMKDLIEEAFQTKTFESYGGCEFGRVGATCIENRDKLHINQLHAYLEFVKPCGEPAEEGELANILTTGLSSFGMPLVRVEHGDVGRYYYERCSCGRDTKMVKVEGRIQSILTTENGFEPPEKVYNFFLSCEGVDFFRLEQKEDEAVLRLVTNSEFDEEEVKEFVGELLGQEVVVDQVEKLDSENSNKYMMVYSEMHHSFRPEQAREHDSEVN